MKIRKYFGTPPNLTLDKLWYSRQLGLPRDMHSRTVTVRKAPAGLQDPGLCINTAPRQALQLMAAVSIYLAASPILLLQYSRVAPTCLVACTIFWWAVIYTFLSPHCLAPYPFIPPALISVLLLALCLAPISQFLPTLAHLPLAPTYSSILPAMLLVLPITNNNSAMQHPGPNRQSLWTS